MIYSYCASWAHGGQTVNYATTTLSIPGLAIEVADYHGNYSEYNPQNEDGTYTLPPATGKYQPEAIAAGAEAVGNILLELYEQSFMGEVVEDMKKVNDKLDVLLQSASFRKVSGTLVLESDMLPPSGQSTFAVKLDCPNGAKTVDFHADDATLKAIKATTSKEPLYTAVVLGNCFAPGVVDYAGDMVGYMGMMSDYWYDGVNYGRSLNNNSSVMTNTDGVQFKVMALKAGTYHWTAYYWDE